MLWILLAVLIALVAAVAIALLTRRAPAAAPARTCVRCHGTGWIDQGPERTLNFTGEGFEDRQRPATMCPSCGGTGLS